MTRRDDYSDKVPAPSQGQAPDQLDDTATEALLSGRDVGSGLAPMAAFVQVLRESADRPVQPSVTLAAQMATGVFTGPPELYRAPVHRPQGRGLGTAARRGARASAHSLAAVPRKLAATRLATKLTAVAMAAGLIGAGSAGFAGALPEPVQGKFETVVERVSSYDFPRRGSGDSGGSGERGGVEPGTGTPEPEPQPQPQSPPPAPTSTPTTGANDPPTDQPGQGSPDNPDNRSTDHPGQGNGPPDVPPGQQKKQAG